MARGIKDIRYEITDFSLLEGGNPVCKFYAILHKNAPKEIEIGRNIMDTELYKENRETAINDQASFENEVFAFQDQLLNQEEN